MGSYNGRACFVFLYYNFFVYSERTIQISISFPLMDVDPCFHSELMCWCVPETEIILMALKPKLYFSSSLSRHLHKKEDPAVGGENTPDIHMVHIMHLSKN